MGLGSSSVTTGFGALGSSCDSRVQVDFRSELGNQKFPFDGQGSCAAGDAGGLNFFRSIVTFPRGWRDAPSRPRMSGENSYFSRFFVKFVEVSAAGLATAISAYALAHFGGLLSSSPTPASAPAQTAVQVGPTASEVAGSLRAQPTPPAAAAAVNKQSPAPEQDTDAPVAQPARKVVKDAKALPPRKQTKPDTSVAEKEPRGQKSAEALARAALANVDANRPAPHDALIEPGLADTRSAPVGIQPRPADVPPRQADVGPPPPVAVPPRAPGIEAAPHPLDVQSPPVVQSSPVAPVDMQPRPVVGVDPPPRTSEIPRPPMPVGTASPEIK